MICAAMGKGQEKRGKDRLRGSDRERRTPLWRELFWVAEWFALRRSALYDGVGIPRGNSVVYFLAGGG